MFGQRNTVYDNINIVLIAAQAGADPTGVYMDFLICGQARFFS